MNITRYAFLLFAFIAAATISRIHAAEIDIVKMQAIPAGNYRCNLRIQGKEQIVNFEVNDTDLVCVNASEKGMIGLRGRTMLIGNGVFMTQLQGGDYRATQFWIFNKDGSAAIKEVPDRGEKQRAILVKGKTLEK